jgi:hypothetical protein
MAHQSVRRPSRLSPKAGPRPRPDIDIDKIDSALDRISLALRGQRIADLSERITIVLGKIEVFAECRRRPSIENAIKRAMAAVKKADTRKGA